MSDKRQESPSAEDVLTLLKTKISNLEERVSFLESEVESLQQRMAQGRDETA